jgi:hypothetical protein
MSHRPPPFDPPPDPPAPPRDGAGYWLGLPFRWAYQAAHNGHGIVRVLDITKFRPMPHGLVAPDHPWATGINPATGRYVWHDNVIYRSERTVDALDLPVDDYVVTKTGQFLARRVALSTGPEEHPVGPKRRMPHGINYIHGTSHYNSGNLIFSDFPDALAHLTDRRFRAELWRFVRAERREVLFLFRRQRYHPREYAYFVCAVRSLFPWFCNANGPRGKVLWGNAAPFPAANLITGNWVRDVYALKRPGGAEAVVRPPVEKGAYFAGGPYGGGRRHARWPEKLLAWATYWRIRMRGGKGGLFFVDRRETYSDLIETRANQGLSDEPIARL